MRGQIGAGRKVFYYVGCIIAIIGLVSFLSVFISGALHFGDFSNFEERGRSMALRAVLGIIMIIVGGAVATMGATGLAGSGVVLDPEQARRDVEPYSRMSGGVLKDILDEADIHLGGGGKQEKVIMIRCRACGKLNEEDSKFCQECGKEM